LSLLWRLDYSVLHLVSERMAPCSINIDPQLSLQPR
jgi:hypothetical protein